MKISVQKAEYLGRVLLGALWDSQLLNQNFCLLYLLNVKPIDALLHEKYLIL